MILISAGHHPYAKGASFENFNEYEEAKMWVPFIVNHLGSKGMSVPDGVLREKVAFINSIVNAELAVEIHFNSALDKDGFHIGRGCETLYYPGSAKGKFAAGLVQDELSIIFSPNRGVKEGYYRLNKDYGPDFFLARTKCTALIIEPEFIHRKDKITTRKTEACKIIADVLLAYLGG